MSLGNISKILEEFDEDYGYLSELELKDDTYGKYIDLSHLKHFLTTKLTELVENPPPMGISQWKEYGKRYGYWDYFVEEVLVAYGYNIIADNLNSKIDKIIGNHKL